MVTMEQVIAAQKAQLDKAFGMGAKSVDTLEKVTALNVTAAKTAMDELAAHAQASLSAKDPQAFLALQTQLLQAAPEKAVAYGRHLYDLASGVTAEVAQAAEAQVSEVQATVSGLVESAVRNAPAGSETAVAMMKNAVSAGTTAVESAQKAWKQTADMAQAGVEAVVANAAPAKASRKR